MEELYINDIQAELTPRSIARTLQVNDLAEIKDRQANYSNTIKLPRTTKNIELMEYLGIMGTGTRMPYEPVDVKYVVNGIELVQNGKGIIKSSSSFYTLVIYDGNISMKDLLDNSLLCELNYTSYNHTLTEAVFTGSFSNSSGYIYGLASYYDNAFIRIFRTFPIEVTSPSFYVHTLMTEIFSQKGYTIIGSCLAGLDYLSRVVTMERGFERVITENKTQVYDRDNSGDPEVITTTVSGGFQKDFIIDSYTATVQSNHTIVVDGSIEITKGIIPTWKINVNSNGVIQELIISPFVDKEFSVQLNIGDTLDIVVAITSDVNADIVFQTSYTTIISENLLSIPITFETIIGDMKQIDFVKDIMQNFGMVFRKTRNKNEFEFKCIKEILVDKAGVEDWSDKYSKVLSEIYKPKYAKKNNLNYVYDQTESDVTPSFGDGSILIDNENLTSEKTLFTSSFKASELIGSTYYRAIHWVDEEEDDVITIVTNKDGMRLFKVLLISDSIKYKYKIDAGFSSSTFTGTVPQLLFVGYQTNINNHYLEFQSMLSSYKMITLEMNLSIIDIYQLDFFKLKYFDQLGQYYYLNKVKGFKPNTPVKVELIQIGQDVGVENEIEGQYNGDSIYSGTLSKNTHGEIAGQYNGSSTYMGTLRIQAFLEFGVTGTGVSEGTVCSLSSFIARWHDGINAFPSINDTVYIDSLGATPFVGGNLYYKTAIAHKLKINNSGVVTEKSNC